MSDATKFMGMSKLAFGLVILLVVMVSYAGLTYLVVQNAHLARQGAQTHAAVCNYRADLAQRLASSEAFDALTPAQRVAKYGSLGNLPEATVKQSIVQESAALKSYSGLDC